MVRAYDNYIDYLQLYANSVEGNRRQWVPIFILMFAGLLVVEYFKSGSETFLAMMQPGTHSFAVAMSSTQKWSRLSTLVWVAILSCVAYIFLNAYSLYKDGVQLTPLPASDLPWWSLDTDVGFVKPEILKTADEKYAERTSMHNTEALIYLLIGLGLLVPVYLATRFSFIGDANATKAVRQWVAVFTNLLCLFAVIRLYTTYGFRPMVVLFFLFPVFSVAVKNHLASGMGRAVDDNFNKMQSAEHDGDASAVTRIRMMEALASVFKNPTPDKAMNSPAWRTPFPPAILGPLAAPGALDDAAFLTESSGPGGPISLTPEQKRRIDQIENTGGASAPPLSAFPPPEGLYPKVTEEDPRWQQRLYRADELHSIEKEGRILREIAIDIDLAVEAAEEAMEVAKTYRGKPKKKRKSKMLQISRDLELGKQKIVELMYLMDIWHLYKEREMISERASVKLINDMNEWYKERLQALKNLGDDIDKNLNWFAPDTPYRYYGIKDGRTLDLFRVKMKLRKYRDDLLETGPFKSLIENGYVTVYAGNLLQDDPIMDEDLFLAGSESYPKIR